MLINYKDCLNLIGQDIKKILHIGAHTGEEAEIYSLNGATDIIWFEANDTLIPELQSHIDQFKINQQVCNIALWDKREELIFKVTNNFQSSSFYDLEDHAKYYPQIKVVEEKKLTACRLDSLIDLNFYDFEFINIDTQGAELAILRGMGDLILSQSIKGIYLEINQEALYKDIPLVDEIDAYLVMYGFVRVLTEWTNSGWGDALYVKPTQLLARIDKDATPTSLPSTKKLDTNEQFAEFKQWQESNFSSPSPNSVKRACLLRNGLPNAIWVETGTYLGDSTLEMAKTAAMVFSLEPELELYENASKRFSSFDNVELINGTSEDIFPGLLPNLSGDVCFWLDGHFSGGSTYKGPNDTPITIELEFIKKNLLAFKKLVVMIDDIRLFTGKIHSYGAYPTLDYLVDWARDLALDWHIEHDIFIAKTKRATLD